MLSLQDLQYDMKGLKKPYQPYQCKQFKYVDCQGWGDVGAILGNIAIAILLACMTLKTLWNLKKEAINENDSQYRKSIKRKINLNCLQLIYLIWFVGALSYQLYLFSEISIHKDLAKISMQKLDQLGHVFQNIYIDILNSLNVTVGFLYWKAIRGYYVLSDLQLPVYLRRPFKAAFLVLYSLNLSALIIEILEGYTSLLFQSSEHVFTLITVTLSILCCIGWRIVYRHKILSIFELPKRAIRKQFICNILLLFSSMLRIALYLFQLLDPDWQQELRHRDNNEQCLDHNFVHSIILGCLHVLINLLPSGIYWYLFKAQRPHTQVKQALIQDLTLSRRGSRVSLPSY